MLLMLSHCISVMPFTPPSDTAMSSTNLLKVTQTTNGRPSPHSELPTTPFSIQILKQHFPYGLSCL